MAICELCAEAADENRALYDEFEEDRNLDNLEYYLWVHPRGCGCPCQHNDPKQWEDSYSGVRP